MFWLRRNKKLNKRLNAIVDTAEQVRKSYRPKRMRVVIDETLASQKNATARQDEDLQQQPELEISTPENAAASDQDARTDGQSNLDGAADRPEAYTADAQATNDSKNPLIEDGGQPPRVSANKAALDEAILHDDAALPPPAEPLPAASPDPPEEDKQIY